jgi:HSP20 family protein
MSNLMLFNNGRIAKRNRGNLGTFPAWSSFIDELFNDDLAIGTTGNFNRGMTLPKVNIKETDEAFVLEMAVPGFKKSDFVLDVENDELSISADLRTESTEQEEGYTRREFGFNSFKRTFALPDSAEEAGIKASYTQGILAIEIPKKEEAKPKPARTIKIS